MSTTQRPSTLAEMTATITHAAGVGDYCTLGLIALPGGRVGLGLAFATQAGLEVAHRALSASKRFTVTGGKAQNVLVVSIR